jgi:tryptophanyl-tRNA synthetase
MSSLSEQVLIMKKNLAEVEEHLNKLQGGRKASSSKARASLMKLKKDSHTLRSDIMKYTKDLPVKSRTKKEEVGIEEACQLQTIPESEEPEEKPKADSTVKKARTKRTPKKKD